MKKKFKTLLIIGGTGFIGKNIVEKLKKKFKIFSISTSLPSKKEGVKGVQYFTCDISNKKKLNKTIKKKHFDFVLNLGGNINHKDSKKTFSSHYTGIKNLADFFLDKKITKFIQVGSSLEYGNCKSPHKEQFNINSKSLKSYYGRAKYNATKLLINYYKKYNFPVIILRAYQVYGPYQKINRILPIVITSCLKKKKFACSDGNQLRDFLYVDDFVNLITKLLNKKKHLNGHIFNVGSSKPIKIKKVINTVVKKIKSGLPIFGLLKLRKDEYINNYPSIDKVKKFINWYPKVTLAKGLDRTIAYYKEQIKF